MLTPATTSDIQARFFRELTPRELVITPQLLDDAWDLIQSRRPSINDDLTAGTVSWGAARRVLVAMVSRVLSNPEGKSEEAIDDYRYRRDSVVSSPTSLPAVVAAVPCA
jgi:hypothetical protein